MTPPTVWKAWVAVNGEDCEYHGFHTNGQEFRSRAEAEAYARDLCQRWTLTRRWFVAEVRDGDAATGDRLPGDAEVHSA